MIRGTIYQFLLCLVLAIPAGNAMCQDLNGATEDDETTDAYDEERLPAATFRVNVVDFARPEWERELSMGMVNVIIPDDFKGEQKKLPEYLDMVPGLHVERRGGEGQYSTVTMRGSSSAQVNIYVDGVPQNLGVDGAIDLSLIPLRNVARIEIYRGHVPARFSGAPIGGVINIVTKKPKGFGFNISAGAKSFTGRNADAGLTAPLFGGSLLLGFHRDQSLGDFGYEYTPPTPPKPREGALVQMPYPSCGITLPCTRTRKSNSYKNTDALIKWQNENWYSKFAWKETSRFYPNETNKYGGGPESRIDLDEELQGAYSLNTYHRYQKVDQYDLLLGRRQIWRDLEWGIEASYMKQEKLYDMMDFKWSPDRFQTAYIRYPGEIWNTYDTKRYGLNLDGSYKFGARQVIEFRADFFDEKLSMDGNQRYSLEGGGYSRDGAGGLQAEPAPVTYRRATWRVQASDTISLND
jgi:outer membrane receptor protein involved in Fe transport